jgi:hypothetical protein
MREDSTTVVRSGWTLDGQRIYIEHDAKHRAYRVGTRWAWLLKFHAVEDACDAFEALEFLEGKITEVSKQLACEIRRTPRHRCARKARAMARVAELVRCVDLRLQGLQPQACGSKSAVVRWVSH